MRFSLRVTFEGEAGVDEGGPLTEMFRIFFDEVMNLLLASFRAPDTIEGAKRQQKKESTPDLASSDSLEDLKTNVG